MKLLYILLIFFLVTSFEMGSFNVFLGDLFHNIVIATCFFLIILYFSFKILKYGTVFNVGCLNLQEFKHFSFITLLLATFFIIHAVIIGPIASIKYSGYLLMLFVLITQLTKKDFNKLCIIYFCFMAYVSIAAFVQIILVSISGTSIYDYVSIKLSDSAFFRAPDMVMPYFLTFASAEENASLGPFSFVRAIGFSSEPKYFSALLWPAFAISLSWRASKSTKILLLVRTALLLGLLIAQAYSSLLVICVSCTFYWVMRLHLVNNGIKSLIILFMPIFISLILTVSVVIILGAIPGGGMIFARLNSFIYSVGDFNLNTVMNFGTMGTNIASGEEIPLSGNATMLLNWYRFGHVGFLLYLAPIFFIIYKSVSCFFYLKPNQKWGLAILLSTYVVYYQTFFSQPFTLFSCFILASICFRAKLQSQDVERLKSSSSEGIKT